MYNLNLAGVVLLLASQNLLANDLLRSSIFSTNTSSFSQLYGEHSYSPEMMISHNLSITEDSTSFLIDTNYTQNTKKISKSNNISGAGSYKINSVPLRIGFLLENSETRYSLDSSTGPEKKLGGTIFTQNDITDDLSISLSWQRNAGERYFNNYKDTFSSINKEIGLTFHQDNLEIGLNYKDISKINSRSKGNSADIPSYNSSYFAPPTYSLFGIFGISDSLSLGGEFSTINFSKTDTLVKDQYQATISSKYLVTPKISLNTYFKLEAPNENDLLVNVIQDKDSKGTLSISKGTGNKIGLESNFKIGKSVELGADLSYWQRTDRTKISSSSNPALIFRKTNYKNFYGAVRGGYIF